MNNLESAECEAIGSGPTKNEPPALPDTTPTKLVGIYGLRNKVNGKWYIGQSIDIHQRWNDAYKLMHCAGQKKIYRALKKYGYDSFDKVILEVCAEDVGVLNAREEYWTLFYGSIKTGYNIRLAGRSPMYGRNHTETHKKYMSKKMTGRKYSAETIQRFSVAATGRKHTEETKQKLKLAWQRRRLLGNIITDAGRKKIADTHRGKIFSDERRRKISEGIKRAWDRRKLDSAMFTPHNVAL